MNHKKLIAKKLIAAAAAGTLILTLPMTGCNFLNQNESSESQNSNSGSASTSADKKDETVEKGIAMKSEHYQIPFNVFQYFYNYNYVSFTSTYGTSMLDPNKDLNEQYYSEEEKITWKDYFISSTKEYFSQIMLFAEAAQAAGLKLTDEDIKTLDDSYNQMVEVAKENNKTIDEYFKELYGDGITKEDIRNMQEMSTLGLKYRNQLNDGYKITDQEYEAEYNKNKTQYQVADYYTYTFNVSTSSDEESQNSASSDNAKKAIKEYADALANSTNAKEFNDYLTKYLKANPGLVHVETSGEESLTEEKFNSSVNDAVESCARLKAPYDDTTDTAKWIFDSSRKAGDTNILEIDTGYQVVLVEKPLYRDESSTRSVRHILIDASSVVSAGIAADAESVTDEQIKAQAVKIYNEWTSKDTTEDKFAELANKYSTDPGSNTNGGLYTNVTEGQMVPTFNDWLFDKGRKQGDSGIVKSDYGYHIMYYVGTGLKSWQISMDATLRQQKLNEDYESFKTKYNIEYDDELISKVQITQTDEESAAESSAANLANQ